jgi:hypothetical protein
MRTVSTANEEGSGIPRPGLQIWERRLKSETWGDDATHDLQGWLGDAHSVDSTRREWKLHLYFSSPRCILSEDKKREEFVRESGIPRPDLGASSQVPDLGRRCHPRPPRLSVMRTVLTADEEGGGCTSAFQARDAYRPKPKNEVSLSEKMAFRDLDCRSESIFSSPETWETSVTHDLQGWR